MAMLVGRNRNDLKKCFNEMLHHVMTHDLDEVNISVNLFESLVLKYCIARNQDFEVFKKPLHGIKWSCTHFVTPRIRTKRLYQQLAELHEIFVKSEGKMSLPSKLKMISEDLTFALSLLFESSEDFDSSEIFDGFEAISELAGEIEKEGFKTYQIYRQLIRNIGVAKSYIPVSVSKTDQLRPADVKTLKQFMSPVFSVLDDIITTFNEPDEPKKTGDKEKAEKYKHLDIDEVKRGAKQAEAMRLIFRENWNPGTTARHLNMTLEELFDLLEIDVETEVEDEKKAIPDTIGVEIEKKELPEAEDKEKDKSTVDDKE